MKLIIGLGNPGKQYEGTRHNAGFMFLDRLVCRDEIAPVGECILFQKNDKFAAEIAETNHKGEKLIFVKPQTFMNLSGQAVRKIFDFYKAELSDLIVASDDVDLPLGSARVRSEGSSGGQKGLQNIIDNLGSDQFTRIRIGIQSIGGDADVIISKDRMDTADFVLSKFEKREVDMLDQTIDTVIAYILPFIGSKQEIPAHTLEVRPDSL